MKFYASVAQLAERHASNVDAAGSLPATCSISRQIVDVLLETQTDWLVSLILTPHSQAILKRLVPPVHPWVKAHHMTMALKPAVDRLEHFQAMAGERLRVKVTGVAQDEQGQAVLVSGPSDNQYPHITVSCADGVSSKYSNDLVARGAKKIKPFWLDGIVSLESLDSTPSIAMHRLGKADSARPCGGSSSF